MKTSSITLFLSLFLTTAILAQDVQGIATYKTQRKMDVALDSTQMNDEMRNRLMAMLKKQFEREYTLEFSANESIYKEVEKLEEPTVGGSGGVQVMVATVGGSDILYKNINKSQYINQNEAFSKQFLIEDIIEQPDWKLGKETKNIGAYTCFKATYTRMARVMTSVRSSSDETSNELEETPEEEITVTAWYTPQIPIKNGPSTYDGLPGLIMEVSDGNETILCSKIVLNPKDGVSLKAPTKGKKVSQVTFDAIMEKKMAEQREQFESSGRRDDGNNIEIRIGG